MLTMLHMRFPHAGLQLVYLQHICAVSVETYRHLHWHLSVLCVYTVSIGQQTSDYWPMSLPGSILQSSAPLYRNDIDHPGVKTAGLISIYTLYLIIFDGGVCTRCQQLFDLLHSVVRSCLV